MDYMKLMKGNRTDVGIWAPACAQHGYTDAISFNDDRYKVKGVRAS